MFDFSAPLDGQILLASLHADASGRVRIKAMLNDGISAGDPAWEHWRRARSFAVCGWGNGILALSCSPWAAAPGGHLGVDGSGRLALGSLADYINLRGRLVALAEADSAQLVLVQADRASAALAALVSFSVSDACTPFTTPLGSG
jgi:hypothetical protein